MRPAALASPFHEYRTARRLEELGRDGVVAIALDRSRLGWVRPAQDAGQLQVEYLGLFRLRALSEGVTARVLVALVRVRRPQVSSHRPAVTGLVYVHYDEAMTPRVVSRLTAGVPWEAWAGDPDGEPGLVNGDEPGRARRAKPAASSASVGGADPRASRTPIAAAPASHGSAS